MSAQWHWFSTMKRRIAYWLCPPSGAVPWQRTRDDVLALAVAEEQHTEGLRLPRLLNADGQLPIAGGRPLSYPVGAWRDINRGTSPYRRRDTGILPPLTTTRQRTGALRPVRMLPAPRADVFAVSTEECAPDLGEECAPTELSERVRAQRAIEVLLSKAKESGQGA